MVILDTSVIVDHLRQPTKGDTVLSQFCKRYSESAAISVISVQELYRGKSTKETDAEQYLLQTLSQFDILPYTHEIAKKAGEITRDSKELIEFGDAAIAAAAILNQAKLFTLNSKHFQGIKDLELL